MTLSVRGWEFIKEKKESEQESNHARVHEKKKELGLRKHALAQESVQEKKNSYKKIKRDLSCFNKSDRQIIQSS